MLPSSMIITINKAYIIFQKVFILFIVSFSQDKKVYVILNKINLYHKYQYDCMSLLNMKH